MCARKSKSSALGSRYSVRSGNSQQQGNANKRQLAGRPSWDDYFMQIAQMVASRSTCLRRKVGAVIVRDQRILSTGYNGAPQKLPHCLEIGCLRDELGIPSGERHEICRGIHAEQNAILQAAVAGTSIREAEIYLTDSPCNLCAKMLINAGITRIVYEGNYPDKMAMKMLKQAGIELERFRSRSSSRRQVKKTSK